MTRVQSIVMMVGAKRGHGDVATEDINLISPSNVDVSKIREEVEKYPESRVVTVSRR